MLERQYKYMSCNSVFINPYKHFRPYEQKSNIVQVLFAHCLSEYFPSFLCKLFGQDAGILWVFLVEMFIGYAFRQFSQRFTFEYLFSNLYYIIYGFVCGCRQLYRCRSILSNARTVKAAYIYMCVYTNSKRP